MPVILQINYRIMFDRKKLKKLIPLPFILAFMTALVTYIRIEETQSFFNNWLLFYTAALLFVVPIGILTFMFINSFINKYLSKQNKYIQGVFFGVFMASIIGSLMTITSIYVIKTFSTTTEFLTLTKNTLQAAFPFMLLAGTFIGGIIKPILTKQKA